MPTLLQCLHNVGGLGDREMRVPQMNKIRSISEALLDQHSGFLSCRPQPFSRRKAAGLLSATVAAVSPVLRSAIDPTVGATQRVPAEAEPYLAGNFKLKEIARERGKIISLPASAVGLKTSPRYRAAVTDGNGTLVASNLLWMHSETPESSLFPDEVDIAHVDWQGVDKVVSVAEYEEVDRLAFEYLIFGDMGYGQSTTGVQRVPNSLLNAQLDYEGAIDLENRFIGAFFAHLEEIGVLKADSESTKVRVGMFNEILNNNVGGDGSITLDPDDPGTWYKGADFWMSKAIESAAPLEHGIPRHIIEGLRTAAPYATKYNVALGIGEWAAETLNDYYWGGENQKAEVLYRVMQALRAFPDPDIQQLAERQLLYVALQNHHDAAVVLNAGIDAYALDVQAVAVRYQDEGIPVVYSEFTVNQEYLSGTQEENDANQATIANAIVWNAFNAGVEEVVPYTVLDYTLRKQGIFDENFQKKWIYAAIAAATAGERVDFF